MSTPAPATRRITILGATGSIGASTLDVVARHPDRFAVTALAANRQWQPLLEQVARFRPPYAALLDAPQAKAEAEMLRQADALLAPGANAVLMKGGHLEGKEAADLLVTQQGVRRYGAVRVASRNLHGTGCTLSSAIAGPSATPYRRILPPRLNDSSSSQIVSSSICAIRALCIW